MIRTTTNLCLILGTCVWLSGCATLAPDYAQPELPVSQAWPAGAAYGERAISEPTAAELSWREFFLDEKLQKLIALALENNRDLHLAALNIERARAQYQIKRADLLPQVDAAGAGSGQRIPADLSGTGRGATVHQYSVGLGVSAYELDLFGRVRSLKDQAMEQYLATEEAQRAVRIALTSDVAASYLTLAADHERLNLARETLKSHEATYELTKRRFEAGISSELAVHQARTSIEAARVDIARYTSLTAEDENALRFLVGIELPAELLGDSTLDSVGSLRQISAGLPSEVLQQRPDILQAEHLLQGYQANIGAARAAFFPRITLIGSLGTASAELDGLFKDGSLAWSFAPRISVPIFDAGRNRANLEVAQADRDIALARYEKAIQVAFREVADALARLGTIDEQLAAQQALVEATAQTQRLSQVRFDKGIDNFLSVLDAQRSFYSAQQNLIYIRLARLTNQVTLYKVLGGGDW